VKPANESLHELPIGVETSAGDDEIRAHLQSRTRTLAAVVANLGLAFFVLDRVTVGTLGDLTRPANATPALVAHVAGWAVALAVWILLSRRRLSMRAVVGAETTLLFVSMATVLTMHALLYRSGNDLLVPVLALFIQLRASIVPSTGARTFWLSFPAVPAVLGIALLHGRGYAVGGGELSRAWFVGRSLVWGPAVLLAAVVIAAITSTVNFTLRRQARAAKRLGQYALEEKIGEGGLGQVYRATHSLLKRATAVKLLRPELTGAETLQRFEREVQLAARLTHPNTISIYDYGHTPDGIFYYAMEYLRGEDLKQVVDRTGPMPASRVLHLLSQACGALAEAHSIGLVHRDVKPANLYLCELGGEYDVLKVIDFGLVKEMRGPELTRAGEFVGTPETMAPEMLRGEAIGPAADLYALGAVGCFLLTGRPIFDVKSAAEFVVGHLDREPVRPSARVPGVPGDLEAILLRCLRKDPAERPPSAAALRDELSRCADHGRWTPADAARFWRERMTAGGRS